MYLTDFNKMVKQVLPPHWRDTWKEDLIRCLIEPIVQDYEHFYGYIYSIPQEVNLNSQDLVMEANLNRIAGHSIRLIYINDGEENGSYIVNIPAGDPAMHKVIEYLESYTIGGVRFYINEY